jgi:hypothetical protein
MISLALTTTGVETLQVYEYHIPVKCSRYAGKQFITGPSVQGTRTAKLVREAIQGTVDPLYFSSHIGVILPARGLPLLLGHTAFKVTTTEVTDANNLQLFN